MGSKRGMMGRGSGLEVPTTQLSARAEEQRRPARNPPRRLVAVFALTLAGALVALGLVSLTAWRTYRALEAAAAKRQTAYEFLMALRLLRQHVGEARVGVTGYAFSRDSAYRGVYNSGVGGFASDTAKLRELARGQQTLQPPLDRLGPALAAYKDALAAAMDAAEQGPPSEVGPAIRRSRDALLLEGVRHVIVALEGEQTRLMESGAREVAEAVRRSRAIIIEVLAAGVVLILGAGGALFAQILRRERVQRTLRRREQQLSSIYDTVAEGIFLLELEKDGGYRFASVNAAFRAAKGLEFGQAAGKRVDEVIPQPTLSQVLEKFAEAALDNKIVRWEETLGSATETLTGEVSVAPVVDDAGRCTHLVGVVHDITERKRSEEEIRRLNAALEARVTERTAQLEAANQELDAFAYSVSHDLRAPLRRVDGFSEILLEDHGEKLDEAGREVLSVIRKNTQDMGHLISDLLAFSRLAGQKIQAGEVDMAALARRASDEVSALEAGRAIEFRVSPLPPAIGDGSLLKQVWLNLLSNAAKYTRPRAHALVEVTAAMEGSEIVYTVRDNGVGFDMQHAGRLFGVFQRLHAPHEFEGTGVGLALVQRIVRRHGGRIWAESKPDEGAAFSFSLPVV